MTERKIYQGLNGVSLIYRRDLMESRRVPGISATTGIPCPYIDSARFHEMQRVIMNAMDAQNPAIGGNINATGGFNLEYPQGRRN